MEAVDAARSALGTTPPGHGVRSVYLRSLSERLLLRYSRQEHEQDLQKAVILAEEAKTCAADEKEQNVCFSTFRYALSRRFKRLGNRSDIDRAISLEKIILSVDENDLDFLVDSASDLITRSNEFEDTKDLQEALEISHEAIRIAFLVEP